MRNLKRYALKAINKQAITVVLMLLYNIGLLNGQTVPVTNGSFESAEAMISPQDFNCMGWKSSDLFPTETKAVIQSQHAKEISHSPSKGQSYLSLVARENGTYNSVIQKLPQYLPLGLWYSFSIDLCKSSHYTLDDNTSKEEKNYTQPLILSIYGYDKAEKERVLLAKSELVQNEDWKTSTFYFEAPIDVYLIELEAGFPEGKNVGVNGHVLVDNMTDFNYFVANDKGHSLDSLVFKNPSISDSLRMLGYQEKVQVNKNGGDTHTYTKGNNTFKFLKEEGMPMVLNYASVEDPDEIINEVLQVGKFDAKKLNTLLGMYFSTEQGVQVLQTRNGFAALKISFENKVISKVILSDLNRDY